MMSHRRNVFACRRIHIRWDHKLTSAGERISIYEVRSEKNINIIEKSLIVCLGDYPAWRMEEREILQFLLCDYAIADTENSPQKLEPGFSILNETLHSDKICSKWVANIP